MSGSRVDPIVLVDDLGDDVYHFGTATDPIEIDLDNDSEESEFVNLVDVGLDEERRMVIFSHFTMCPNPPPRTLSRLVAQLGDCVFDDCLMPIGKALRLLLPFGFMGFTSVSDAIEEYAKGYYERHLDMRSFFLFIFTWADALKSFGAREKFVVFCSDHPMCDFLMRRVSGVQLRYPNHGVAPVMSSQIVLTHYPRCRDLVRFAVSGCYTFAFSVHDLAFTIMMDLMHCVIANDPEGVVLYLLGRKASTLSYLKRMAVDFATNGRNKMRKVDLCEFDALSFI